MKKIKGDKLDKYRDHLLEDRPLKPDELEMLARYRKAHALSCLGFSRNQVISTLEKEFDLSTSQFYNLVKDATRLFGSIEEVDKKGRRVISIERYELLGNLARKDGNILAAIRAQENVDRLLGLFEADDQGMDPRAFLVPVDMVFSTNPEVFKEQQKLDASGGIEDTDYEEVE